MHMNKCTADLPVLMMFVPSYTPDIVPSIRRVTGVTMLYRCILVSDALRDRFKVHHVVAGPRFMALVTVLGGLFWWMLKGLDDPGLGRMTASALRSKTGTVWISIGMTV